MCIKGYEGDTVVSFDDQVDAAVEIHHKAAMLQRHKTIEPKFSCYNCDAKL